MAAMLGGVIAFGIWTSFKTIDDPIARGKDLNQRAWDITYTERGLAIPETGPRDGYWGERIDRKAPHPVVSWTEPNVELDDILQIDNNGMQFFHPASKPTAEVLFVGGSVAFGTYASGHDETYFCQLGKALERAGLNTRISVFAAGAWKSVQDLKAVEFYTQEFSKPDVVVFLNGLNDLTNGSNAKALFGQKTQPKDGSAWNYLYHEHDYQARVDLYLENMRRAAEFSAKNKQQMLVVLQPALFEKTKLTATEQELLEGSLLPHESASALLKSYADIRQGLLELAQQPHVAYVDASRLFNDETATTFTDIWHFSDVGHEMLAQSMLDVIQKLLAPKK